MAHSVVNDLSGETQEYFYDGHLPSLFISDGQKSEISELLSNNAVKGKLKNENYNAENFLVKFIYSEKATKFCEIFPLLLATVHTVHTVKSKGNISQGTPQKIVLFCAFFFFFY